MLEVFNQSTKAARDANVTDNEKQLDTYLLDEII